MIKNSDRQQSDTKEVTTGMPQESILGHLLFVIYVILFVIYVIAYISYMLKAYKNLFFK